MNIEKMALMIVSHVLKNATNVKMVPVVILAQMVMYSKQTNVLKILVLDLITGMDKNVKTVLLIA